MKDCIIGYLLWILGKTQETILIVKLSYNPSSL